MRVEWNLSSEKGQPRVEAGLPPYSLLTQTAPMREEIDCKCYLYLVRWRSNLFDARQDTFTSWRSFSPLPPAGCSSERQAKTFPA
jgi:hypothetical protein